MEESITPANTVTEPENEINGQIDKEKEEIPMEIVKDDKDSPARLVINGCDDENEETVLMSIEEAHNYILTKVSSYIRDPNVNPLLVLKNQISVLESKIKTKNEEFVKLKKMFDALHRDQVKFLRYIGVMPKLDTNTVGIGVDLPWLPCSMPDVLPEDLLKCSGDRVFLPSSNAPVRPKTEPSGPIECIDLTDDAEVPDPSVAASTSNTQTPTTPVESKHVVSSSPTSTIISAQNILSSSGTAHNTSRHPAPLPDAPGLRGNEPDVPPKPRLKISVDKNGIVLQWDLPPDAKNAKPGSFEIVGYQEKNNVPVSSSLWKKIGCVKLMPLPMSCTLTQFVEGFKYHFSIRAISKDQKYGLYSDPASIMFVPETKKN